MPEGELMAEEARLVAVSKHLDAAFEHMRAARLILLREDGESPPPPPRADQGA